MAVGPHRRCIAPARVAAAEVAAGRCTGIARRVRGGLEGTTTDEARLPSAPMLEVAWTNRPPADRRPVAVGSRRFDGYGRWGPVGRIVVDPGEALHLTSIGEGGWSGAASTWCWVDRARRFSGLVFAQYVGSAVPLGQRTQAAACAALLG